MATARPRSSTLELMAFDLSGAPGHLTVVRAHAALAGWDRVADQGTRAPLCPGAPAGGGTCGTCVDAARALVRDAAIRIAESAHDPARAASLPAHIVALAPDAGRDVAVTLQAALVEEALLTHGEVRVGGNVLPARAGSLEWEAAAADAAVG